jgi:class 3 adenylate cyclase
VRVRDFPTGREWIAAIIAGGPGFVAVGASQVVHLGPGTPCYGDYDGRIWTSPDGRHWSRQSVGLDKTPLTHVVEFNGVVYAFGRPGDTCDRRGDRGYSVWSSADGMAWTLAAVEVGAPYGAIFDVVATDSRLVALGWDTNRHSQAWLSDDGSTWSVPQVPPLSVAWGASLGDTVVAFDNPDDPVTGLQVDVSYDAGANWQQVFVEPNDVFEVQPGHDAWVLGDEPAVVIDFLGNIEQLGRPASKDRIVTTLLMTDIVDSTATASRLGDATWKQTLGEHNRLVRARLERYLGKEVNTTGDGFLAMFASAIAAIRCAASIRDATNEFGLPVRIGIHTGEVELLPGDIGGVSVHAAARVMALGGASDVIVSATTRGLVLDADVHFESRGVQRLKGLPTRLEVFALVG